LNKLFYTGDNGGIMRYKYLNLCLILGIVGTPLSHASFLFDSFKTLHEKIPRIDGNNRVLLNLDVDGNQLRKCMLASRSPGKAVVYLGLRGIKSLWNRLGYEINQNKRLFSSSRMRFLPCWKSKNL
jgi:hypothetical protein